MPTKVWWWNKPAAVSHPAPYFQSVPGVAVPTASVRTTQAMGFVMACDDCGAVVTERFAQKVTTKFGFGSPVLNYYCQQHWKKYTIRVSGYTDMRYFAEVEVDVNGVPLASAAKRKGGAR